MTKIDDETEQKNQERLRYSVNLISQGKHQFYSVTIPSDVLGRTCKVSNRKEDPKKGFQRVLDKKRSQDIANYIDNNIGSIPNSIILSAQEEADLKIVGRGKTVEFSDIPGAFLILDGQHRVYGFQIAKTKMRVPVIIYNGLSRSEETRLFIDINTKQRPVPSSLLLDIKKLADIESNEEAILREIFDLFHNDPGSILKGQTSPSETIKNRITRVTFNSALKSVLPLLNERETDEVYEILNSYLSSINSHLIQKSIEGSIGKPVIFRALISIFVPVAQKVFDRYEEYSEENFSNVLEPVFQGMPKSKLVSAGPSWSSLASYLEDRIKKKQKI